MEADWATAGRAQVEDFRRRHRIGLVTLLFTDIIGSTQLKQTLGDARAVALIQRHHSALREMLGRFSEGEEIDTAGDSFFIVFAKPSDAVRYSLQVEARLRLLARETGASVFDRIGIHVGEVFIDDAPSGTRSRDLFGLQVDTCARIMSLGGAHQILASRFAFDSARQVLKGEDIAGIGLLSWLNHGTYSLKGVDEPIEICEVGEEGEAALSPPGDSEKAHRHLAPGDEPVLGWRPAANQAVPNTKWILERNLGEGGFGEVWLGRHETLKERRVFKFCFNAERVRSLKREVTIFRLLKENVGAHPNIVAIEDVFFDEPPFYIAMEHVPGDSLGGWFKTKGGAAAIPTATLLEIVAQVADALQAAHECGVIHRDVKPQNILIQEANGSPQAKLTDFGIGKVVSQEVLAGMTRLGFTQTLESTCSQSGTQLYMAPELFAGKSASTGSDIYALGVVLYQMLIGDFSSPVTTDWSRRISDPLLCEDLAKCFAGDTQERFSRAKDLAANIRSMPIRLQASAQRDTEDRHRLELVERRSHQLRLYRFAGAAVIGILIGWLALGTPGVPGIVEIKTDPPGAQVWQNGSYIGTTPYSDESVWPGRVQYEIKAAGYQGFVYVGRLRSRQELAVQASLRPVVPARLAAAKIEPELSPGVRPSPVVGAASTTAAQATPHGATLPVSINALSDGEVISKENQVEVLRDGKWVSANVGTRLHRGDRLRTGESSYATVRMSDTSVLRMDELTETTIVPITRPGGLGLPVKVEEGGVYFFDNDLKQRLEQEKPHT